MPELIPAFSMKRRGVFYSPLDWMLVHRRATPSSKFFSTHLYTWVKRGTVRVKCLAQEYNIVPGSLDPGSSALTIRPPRLPHNEILQRVSQNLFQKIYLRACSNTIFILQNWQPWTRQTISLNAKVLAIFLPRLFNSGASFPGSLMDICNH